MLPTFYTTLLLLPLAIAVVQNVPPLRPVLLPVAVPGLTTGSSPPPPIRVDRPAHVATTEIVSSSSSTSGAAKKPASPFAPKLTTTASSKTDAMLGFAGAGAGLGPPPAAVVATNPLHDDANNTECRLLGPFAILVQLALGALALLSLVYKRWRERPQRPVRIWFFDASKQVFGSALVHVANVFMSMLTSGRFSIKAEPGTVAAVTARSLAALVLGRRSHEYMPNPCSFYLLNLAIDTTLGIPILIGLLRLTTRLVSYTSMGKPAESIQSGNYGQPPKAMWWLKQSVIYFCGLLGMKICVLFLFMVMPWISHVGDWALQWTEGNEKLQIVFSMMLFPLIMNALQYYIIDSFIKKKDESGPYAPVVVAHEEVRGGGRARDLYEALSAAGDADGDISDGDISDGEGPFKPTTAGRTRSRQYDPAPHGDNSAPSRHRSRSRKSIGLRED